MTTLYSYQERAVRYAINSPGKRWIFNEITGAGKTVECIATIEQLDHAKSILVVAPAVVLLQWQEEFVASGLSLDIGVIDQGIRKTCSKANRQRLQAAQEAGIQIVSQALIKHVLPRKLDAIVLDECHMFQHCTSQMSKNVRALILANPQAAVFGLTGTLLANSPGDFWNIADMLCPGRFGQQSPNYPDALPWLFGERYMLVENTEYGRRVHGVNPRNYKEFSARIAGMSSRADLEEVLPYLPPLNVKRRDIDAGTSDIDAALDWLKALQPGARPVILVYRKKTMRDLTSAVLASGFSANCVYSFDGNIPIKQRLAMIAAAKANSNSLVIATMHSCGRGINGLSYATNVLFCQLYARPETIVQAIGRFPRIGGQKNLCEIDLQIVPNTESENNYLILREKIDDFNMLIPAGNTEKAFMDAAKAGSPEQLDRALLMAVASQIDDDFLNTDDERDDDEPEE